MNAQIIQRNHSEPEMKLDLTLVQRRYPEADLEFISAHYALWQRVLHSNRKMMNRIQFRTLAYVFQASAEWHGSKLKKDIMVAQDAMFRKIGIPPALGRSNWCVDILWLYVAYYLGRENYDPQASLDQWFINESIFKDEILPKKIQRLGSIEKLISVTSLVSYLFNRGQIITAYGPALLEQSFSKSIRELGAKTFLDKYAYLEQGSGVISYYRSAIKSFDFEHPLLKISFIVSAIDLFDLFSDKNSVFAAYQYLNWTPEYRTGEPGAYNKQLEFYLNGILYAKEIKLYPYQIVYQQWNPSAFRPPPDSGFRQIMQRFKELLPARKSVYLPQNFHSDNFTLRRAPSLQTVRAMQLIKPLYHDNGKLIFDKGTAFYLHYDLAGKRLNRRITAEPKNVFEIDIKNTKASLRYHNQQNKDANKASLLLKKDFQIKESNWSIVKKRNPDINRSLYPIHEMIKIQDYYTVVHSYGVARLYSNMVYLAAQQRQEILTGEELKILTRHKVEYPFNPQTWITPQQLNWAWFAAYTHDIGKKDINSYVLQKEGSLTSEEYAEIKKHPSYTASALMEFGIDFLLALNIFHHISADQSFGYPEKVETSHGIFSLLRGQPACLCSNFSSNLMAIADFLHTREGRPYTGYRKSKPAFLKAEIKRCSGIRLQAEDWAAILEERIHELKARAKGIISTSFQNQLEKLMKVYHENDYLIDGNTVQDDITRLCTQLSGYAMPEESYTGTRLSLSSDYDDYFKKIWQSWFTQPYIFDTRAAKFYFLFQKQIHGPLLKSNLIYGLPGGGKLLIPEENPFNCY